MTGLPPDDCIWTECSLCAAGPPDDLAVSTTGRAQGAGDDPLVIGVRRPPPVRDETAP